VPKKQKSGPSLFDNGILLFSEHSIANVLYWKPRTNWTSSCINKIHYRLLNRTIFKYWQHFMLLLFFLFFKIPQKVSASRYFFRFLLDILLWGLMIYFGVLIIHNLFGLLILLAPFNFTLLRRCYWTAMTINLIQKLICFISMIK
jgi:hypothetical protein